MPPSLLRPYSAKAIIEHEFDTDHLNIFITFRFAMDTSAKPDHDLWICEVDDVAKNVTVSAWQDPWTLLLTVPNVVVLPDRVTLEYNGPDENLRITWNKQWEPWGAILSKDIGKERAYDDRGDLAVYDYAKEDLTIDGAWHDMDLSGIVPEQAKSVFIVGHLMGAGVDWHIRFRKNGNVNDIVHGGMETLRANVERHRSSIVALDENRVIEYNVDNQAWNTLDLAVKGWWF